MTYQPSQYDPQQHQQRMISQYPQPYQPQQWQQPVPRYAAPPQVAPKSAGLGMLLSLIIPGLGAVYGGEVAWGLVILAVWLVSWPLAFVVIGLITLPLAWIIGIVAGYRVPQRWNRRHGIIS